MLKGYNITKEILIFPYNIWRMNEVHDQNILSGFHPAVKLWFEEQFTSPSPPQELGWPHIRAGRHVLILSATGSGKTLAAFLEVLNRMYQSGTGRGVQVVYVSPLKALNNDIARNLMAPLKGISAAAGRLGLVLPEIRVAVRTGDTPGRERQAMVRRPPDILITTPESLYLILSSPKARQMLRAAHTVIIDEIHALAGNKRGVHLSLSIERLEHLAGRPLQRIGLSATQKPLELIASFLGGLTDDGRVRPVQVVDARQAKKLVLKVTTGPDQLLGPPGSSIWPRIHEKILAAVEQHRSTLVFVNSRAWAERVARGINELAGSHIARTHHGSLSREAREEVETALKAGQLKALVCTSSLELGIDIGAVDLVIQIASPYSPTSGLQRVGRSGHVLGAASRGVIMAKTRPDLLDAAWVAKEMLCGEVEPTHVPECCLDILAQHIVSMVGVEDWSLDRLLALVQKSWCYRRLTREQLLAVVELLSGRYPARDLAELRPKLAWQRQRNTLHALPGTRAAAVSGCGTIPDKGYYAIYLSGHHVKLGELEEEFVFESRAGDVIIFGTRPWRITAITHDRVLVEPAASASYARMPFWRGEFGGRQADAGRRFGRFLRFLAENYQQPDIYERLAAECGLEENAAAELVDYIAAQMEHSGVIPTDRCLFVESYLDEVGDYRIILHSPFGARTHAAWEMAARRQLRLTYGLEAAGVVTEHGIAWHIPRGTEPPPLESLIYLGEDPRQLVIEELPGTALFGAYFRMNAARSLLLGRSAPGRRLPLWLQRLKAGDLLHLARRHSEFPVALETFRECLDDVLDVPGLTEVQREISAGHIKVVYRHSAVPSPFALAFQLEFTGAFLYDDDTPKAELQTQFLSLNREMLQEILAEKDLRHLLDPAAVKAAENRRQRLEEGLAARNADELEEILLALGDLDRREVEARCLDPAFLQELLAAGRAVKFGKRFIAAEEAHIYTAALAGTAEPASPPPAGASPGAVLQGTASPEAQEESRLFLLRRLARNRGPFTIKEVTARYPWPPEVVEKLLAKLCAEGVLVKGAFLPDGRGEEWCHHDVLREVHRRTLAALRQELEPVPPSSLVSFLADWQRVTDLPDEAPPLSPEEGVERLRQVLSAFSGLFLPVEVWERDVLPLRLPGYDPAWLDRLCAAGEFVWVGLADSGAGAAPAPGTLKAAFFPRSAVAGLLPLLQESTDRPPLSAEARRIAALLKQKGASFLTDLQDGFHSAAPGGKTLQEALWELVAAGLVTNDTFAPLRQKWPLPEQKSGAAASGFLSPLPVRLLSQSQERRLFHELRQEARWKATALTSMTGGRWNLLPGAGNGEQHGKGEQGGQLEKIAALFLSRWGILTKEILAIEGAAVLWASLYRTLRLMEMTGKVRSGYLVSGLGGSQFATTEAIEKLRSSQKERPPRQAVSRFLLVNTCDPLAGAAQLGSPALPSLNGFVRSPLNYVVICDDHLVLFAAGFGRHLHYPPDTPEEELHGAVTALTGLLSIPGHLRPRRAVAVARCNGRPVQESKLAGILLTQGFQPSGEQMILWPSRRLRKDGVK